MKWCDYGNRKSGVKIVRFCGVTWQATSVESLPTSPTSMPAPPAAGLSVAMVDLVYAQVKNLTHMSHVSKFDTLYPAQREDGLV